MNEGDYREPDSADPATAFERLRGEVSLLRHAVEGLTAARESIDIPDYQPTLARTETVLAVLAQRIETVVKSPALTLTPNQMAEQIAGAASMARREDQRLVSEARTALDQATRALHGVVASARTGDEQNWWLLWTGLGAAILGCYYGRSSPAWSLAGRRKAGAGPSAWRRARLPSRRCGMQGSA